MQSFAVLSYLRSKPPGKVLLLDLVNIDTTFLTLLTSSVIALVHLVVHAGIELPNFVAAFAAHAMFLSGLGLFVYLAIGSVLQYLHLRFKTVSLFGSLLDGKVMVCLRTFVVAVSFGANIGRLYSDPALLRSTLSPHALNFNESAFNNSMSSSFSYLGKVMIACVLTDVLFKFLSKCEKRKLAPKSLKSTGPTSGMIMKGYMLYSFLCVTGASFGILAGFLNNDFKVSLRAYLFIPVFCICLPMSFILSDKKIPEYLDRNMRRRLGLDTRRVSPL